MEIKYFKNLFFSLVIFIFGLSGSLLMVINSSWLFKLSLNSHVLSLVNLTKAQVFADYKKLLQYLEFPWISKLQLTYFPFSKGGLIHMSDVKLLFLINAIIFCVSGITMVLLVRHLKRNQAWWRLINGVRNALIITPIVAVFVSIDFNRWFILFHQMFFSNDYWIFDPQRDPIILVLTDTFFAWSALLCIALLEIYLYIVYRIIKKQVIN